MVTVVEPGGIGIDITNLTGSSLRVAGGGGGAGYRSGGKGGIAGIVEGGAPYSDYGAGKGAGGIPASGSPAQRADNGAGLAVQNTGAGGGGGGEIGGLGGSGIVVIVYPT